jgi:hypothetical protein
MKLVTYTLNEDGTIPSDIIDGGYLAVKNQQIPPQDYTFIGLAEDSNLRETFTTKQNLIDYLKENKYVFIDLNNQLETSLEENVETFLIATLGLTADEVAALLG